MMKVFKYPIEVTDYQSVTLPQNAEILTVQVQNGMPCIWALVNPDNKAEVRKFRLAGTGHDISTDEARKLNYIGTIQMRNGMLVFHLFEIKEV
jgi:hypothetical protein